jgi:RNA recognition motif-containing protein
MGGGSTLQISVNRNTPFNQAQKNGPTGSAYVTYVRNEDALRAIQEVDGAEWGGEWVEGVGWAHGKYSGGGGG